MRYAMKVEPVLTITDHVTGETEFEGTLAECGEQLVRDFEDFRAMNGEMAATRQQLVDARKAQEVIEAELDEAKALNEQLRDELKATYEATDLSLQTLRELRSIVFGPDDKGQDLIEAVRDLAQRCNAERTRANHNSVIVTSVSEALKSGGINEPNLGDAVGKLVRERDELRGDGGFDWATKAHVALDEASVGRGVESLGDRVRLACDELHTLRQGLIQTGIKWMAAKRTTPLPPVPEDYMPSAAQPARDESDVTEASDAG